MSFTLKYTKYENTRHESTRHGTISGSCLKVYHKSALEKRYSKSLSVLDGWLEPVFKKAQTGSKWQRDLLALMRQSGRLGGSLFYNRIMMFFKNFNYNNSIIYNTKIMEKIKYQESKQVEFS